VQKVLPAVPAGSK